MHIPLSLPQHKRRGGFSYEYDVLHHKDTFLMQDVNKMTTNNGIYLTFCQNSRFSRYKKSDTSKILIQDVVLLQS